MMKPHLASRFLHIALILVLSGCKPLKDQHTSDVLAYSESEVANKFGVRVIREVRDLESGGRIPSDVFERFDSRTIAETVIYRLHTKFDDIDAGSPIVNQRWLDDSLLAMRFDESLIAKIAANGFLNQHQTGSSRGFNNPTVRLSAESNLSDLSLGGTLEHEKKLLPKYSWVSLRNGANLGNKTSDASRYGSWIAVFRKEVKFRATLTYQDSLDSFMKAEPSAVRRRGKQATFYSTDAYSNDSLYLEAQIWGELDLRDVEEILIPTSSVPQSLLAIGLPVSRYDVVQENGRYSIEVLERLHAGDSAKADQYAKQRRQSRKFDGRPYPPPLSGESSGLR